MATAIAHAAAATPLAASQSLLFQLEIDGRDVLRPKPPPPRRDLHAILDRLDAMCRPETNFEARLARDARYYHAATLEEEGRADVVILASRLAGVGYDVTIRTALGGGLGVSAFKHLSHEFLVVAGPPESFHYGGAAEYIVDPRFREQFDIPQTVAWYDELLVSVPEAYTGPPARLRALVRLLSSEMGAAFAAAGAVTPPWRSAGALLSKWLPAKARDKHISDPHLSSASSVPTSPDAGGPPPPSSSVPVAAGFGGTGFGGPAFKGGAAGGPRPTFATAGEDLRTTSAPAVAPEAAGTTTAAAADLSGSKQPQQQQPGAAASGGAVSPAAQAQHPQPEGRSDSEDDHLSSPDTTLAWRLPSSSRRGAKAVPAQPAAQPAQSATAVAAQTAAGNVQQGQVLGPPGAAAVAAAGQPQRRRMPRTISREQLLAGSGGRSPPKASEAATAAVPLGTTKPPPHIPSLRASDDGSAASPAGAAVPQPAAPMAVAAGPAAAQAWADASQYAAHPQTLPAPRRGTTSAPAVASAGSDASGGYTSCGDDSTRARRKVSGSLSDTAVDVKALLAPDAKPGGEAPQQQQQQQPQLRTRSTSALSSKLASAGFISKRASAAANSAANAASSAAFSKAAAFQPAAQPAAGDSPSGEAGHPLHCGTGTLPAGTRLPTSPPDAAAPQPTPPAAPKQQREPSVEAPFWDQPLIRNFIATQREQPLPPPPIKTRVSGAGPGADAYLQGEPRIRTVKMRGGAGVSTHHVPPRRPMRA